MSLDYQKVRQSQSSRVNREYEASIFSRWTVHWMWYIIKTGYRKPVELNDVDELHKDDAVRRNSDELARCWNQEMKKKNPNLWKALWNAYGFNFSLYGIYLVLHDFFAVAGPLLMHAVLRFLAEYHSTKDLSKKPPLYVGYLWSLALLFAQVGQVLVRQQFYIGMNRSNVRALNGLRGLVYTKSLHMSQKVKQQFNTGKISNFMTIDAEKVGQACTHYHYIWGIPFNLILCLLLCFYFIGWSILTGFLSIVIVTPLVFWISRLISTANREVLVHKDERAKVMDNILTGIRVIKMYTWEQFFKELVENIRNQEFKKLVKLLMLTGFQLFVIETVPILANLVTFSVYALSGGILKSDNVFTTMALLNNMRQSILFAPTVISEVIAANVSVGRIQEFLMYGEKIGPDPHEDEEEYYWADRKTIAKQEKVTLLKDQHTHDSDEISEELMEKSGIVVRIEGGSFKWEIAERGPPTLQGVDLTVKRGELVSIIGEVGSGKSSLLGSIFGDIEKIRGNMYCNGRIAYCAQQPWILNATVRDNILFGKPYDEQRYQQVISACQLEHDFELLPAADFTEIGENGTNLSGGQKHRISLARAVYSDADIYLLDSVLGAVDAHVGKKIFKKCILGLLANKTRIFTTHSLQYLPHSNQIVVMKDGKIVTTGTYQELLEKDQHFNELMKSYMVKSEEEKSKKKKEKPKEKGLIIVSESKAKLVEAEDRETGIIRFGTYMTYALGYTIPILLAVLASGIYTEVFHVAMDYWLSAWVNGTLPAGKSMGFYLGIYLAFAAVGSLLQLIKCMLFFVGSLWSSSSLHSKMIRRILEAPVSFFDKNPIGRILNRFTKDMNSMDSRLPISMMMMFNQAVHVLGVFAVVLVVTRGRFIPVLLIIAIIYFMFQRLYLLTQRELSRLTSNSRSPILALVSETCTGASTIKAYKAQQMYFFEGQKRMNTNAKVLFAMIFTNRWLALRLEIIGSFVVFFTAVLALLPSASPKFAGLSISYALTFTFMLYKLCKLTNDVEIESVAVERTIKYTKLPTEAPAYADTSPPIDWPDKGRITLEHVYLKYRDELDPVLIDICADILPGERIGIVGRTGSGKTSLSVSLFRLYEIYRGRIFIDNINIHDLGLKELREKIAIIPQDPIVFYGTLRENLDPFKQHTDEQLWAALESVHLKQHVQGLKNGLNEMIYDGGQNLSVGQKQLLCLARAILQKSKIVILDEVTANIDVETDMVIQKTVRETFKGSTIVTIAHRLNTVIDCDRVMVMDSGKLVEFDTPKKLLENKESLFSKMVKESMDASNINKL